MKQNLQQSLEVFREHEEALKQLNDKIRNVDARADSALQNVDKDFVTVLQTKLVTKVIFRILTIFREKGRLTPISTPVKVFTSHFNCVKDEVTKIFGFSNCTRKKNILIIKFLLFIFNQPMLRPLIIILV